LEALNNLIAKLNKEEILLVRQYLEHLNLKKKNDRLLITFFNFLVRNRGRSPDQDKCARFLYGRGSDGKFRMIKTKLRSRLLDALQLDKSLAVNKILDPIDLAGIKMRKRIVDLNYIMFTKGSIPMALEIIDEVVSKGMKYENYLPMIEALRMKKYVRSFCAGIQEFEAINKQIAFYEYCDEVKAKAADYYYKFIARVDFKSSLDKKTYQKYLEESIVELNRDFTYSKSGQVGYYLKLLEYDYFLSLMNFEAARNVGVELLSVIRAYPSVYRKQRVGIAFDNIGQCDIALRDYEKAISNFTAAQKFFPAHSVNFVVSKELEMKACFYCNSIALAEKALNEIMNSPGVALLGDFRSSKYPYYQSHILFKKGKYKEALKEITQQLEIAQDKSGWGIHQRVLAIMCNVELQRFDQATLQVEALLRQVDRMKHPGKDSTGVKLELSQRDALIVKFLVGLSQKGFMYTNLKPEQIKLLEQLAHEKDLQWEPLTPELIPFHEWISAKMPAYRKKQVEKIAAGQKHTGQKQTVQIKDREN
jgi:tetratricopeptide (TPR) repeat protein